MQLNKAADMVDIESVGTHTMHWFYKQSKDVATLQIILNHSYPEITLKYIGVTDEETEDSLNNFVL